ncbi:MAG: CDP-alcohol phosphatidyltransferase family protein [Gemmatimonadales bacterium]
MSSLWKRVTAAHVQFVTTGYLRLMEPIAGLLIRIGISANALTTLGTLFTVIGGVAYASGHMRVGGWIIGITAIADALDGIVARRTGQVTVFGAFYDSTLDRIGDGALLAGIAYFYATSPIYGSLPMLGVSLAGIIGTFMVSYARARAESLGINAKVGVMQRAERVILLCAPQALFGLALDGWVLRVVVVILTVTAWHTAVLRINYVRHSTLVAQQPPLRVMSEKPIPVEGKSSRRAKS